MTDLKQKLDTAADGAADTTGSGMRAEDVLFLIDCLQHTTGGQVQVSSLGNPLSKHRTRHCECCVENKRSPPAVY